ncbi:DUF6966 domain-containing protein [Luteimonas kalidii]|uniref:DUF6966 domain-containing protein n=1 Tax=Luteimonas kalidii TaxID=3042025 RepID=UPI003CE5A420
MRKPATPVALTASWFPTGPMGKPLAGGIARSNVLPAPVWGQLAAAAVWGTVSATGPGSSVAGALTIRSSRTGFAGRLNSVVRCHMDHVTDLEENLAAMAGLLAAAGEDKWRKYIADCQLRVASGDYSGVEKLLLAYGGMGSLNDVQGASDSDHIALHTVLSRSYDLAVAIRRARDRAGT